ncbi:MAG: hypothetical protein ABI874_12980 [Chloroflexota bacterium]
MNSRRRAISCLWLTPMLLIGLRSHSWIPARSLQAAQPNPVAPPPASALGSTAALTTTRTLPPTG